MKKLPFNNHSNMKHYVQQKQQGYILITVIITLFILASISALLNRESSMGVNMTANESRITKARYVAEAGLNHALWQANNANCSGYPNSVINSFGNNNYTVSVSPSSGSPVSVSAEGTLASGETINLNRTNLKIYEPPTIVALQPDPSDGKDTHIYEFQPTFNYGSNQKLDVSALANKIEHSLLQFDITAIPAGFTITSAKLELRIKTTGWDSMTVNVHRVTKDWGESNASWTEANPGQVWASNGGDFDSTIIASAVTPSFIESWVSWDITELVNDWVSGNVPNYGLMLRTTEIDKGVQFSSSDSPTASNRPKLTINYSCECGNVCIQVASCNGTFRDEFNARVFTGSNGTLDWSSSPWVEVGESDGATSGDIQIKNDVSNYQLRTRDNNNGGEGLEREVDLSGASTATLEYEYRRDKLDDSNDYTTVEISANGAAGPWIELARYQGSGGHGSGTDGSYTLVTHDISNYISGNTRIRLKTSANMGGRDTVWFDSVEIQCSP